MCVWGGGGGEGGGGGGGGRGEAGDFVHYNLLKLHYIRNKLTPVSPMAMEAFACNSHVTNVTLK